MESVQFKTPLPYDHVPRALDTLRRMGFALLWLNLKPTADAFHVTISFRQSGLLSAQTLVDRLNQLVGVQVDDAPVDVTGGLTAPDQTMPVATATCTC